MRAGSALTLSALAFALGVLPACNLPYPAPVGSDAAPPDATDPNTVTGTSIVRHYTTAGMTTAPEDLGQYTIKAYVPDDTAATKFRIVDAVVTGPGAFELHDIPPGTPYDLYLLPMGSSSAQFYMTSARTLDLGFATVGRSDVEPLTVPSTLSLTILDMSRWWDADDLSAHSTGAGSDEDVTAATFQTSRIPPGATSIAGFDVDWSKGTNGDPPKLGANRLAGDDLVFLHHRGSTTQLGTSAVTVIEAATAANITQSPGVTLPVASSFAATPPTTITTFTSKRSTLRNLYGSAPFGDDGIAVSIFGSPGAAQGALMNAPVMIYEPVPTDVTISETLMYADPFPSSWGLASLMEYDHFERWVKVPGTTSPYPLIAFITTKASLGATIDAVAGVSPPTSLRVDNKVATDSVIVPDGVTPVTVSWQQVTNASIYVVQAGRLVMQGNGTRLRAAATLFTRDASVAIPAALFNDGDRYVFTVEAIKSATAYDSGSVRDLPVPMYTASEVSGVILFSTTCGNGKVDQGEPCDTGGPTATCNYDCTKPACGDGILNAPAGEQCDLGSDARDCDADCTVPVCGDGYVNTTAGEECDDGNNKDDGNGCSPTCFIQHTHCHDGIVQPYGEECDDGNFVDDDGCTNNCTLPTCGDGVLQIAIGEQCDDGNLVNGDGCSSTCQTEP